MRGWELVTDGAGLWASQNRYNQCPPTSWYPDPRICVALTLSNHQKPGICVGQVQTGPAPAREWGKYHVGVKLSPYYRAKPAGDAAHEEAGAQLTLFAGDQ
jgi:hypothetical protein